MSELLRSLARVGAIARLKDIEGERLTILRAFPDLKDLKTSAPAKAASVAPAVKPNGPVKPKQVGTPMPAWRRKQISKWMTAYWANKRAEKKSAARR